MIRNIKKFLLLPLLFLTIQNIACAEVFEFAQASDVHYTLGNSVLDKYLYFLSLSLKKKSPNFIIFLGDNVNKSTEEDTIGFMRAIHAINIPYYLVFGEKDAHSLSGIEKSVYLDIVSTFSSYQNEKENYYYFKPNKDIVCVVIDDSSDFAPSNHGEVSDEQVEWLNKLLYKNKKKLFIIFEHSPLLPPRDDYKLSMINTEKYQTMLKKHKNIILISSGHYHQESIQTDDLGVRHISAPAFKDTPHSYQLIKIIYNKKSYKSPKDVEVTVTNIKV